MSGQMSGSPSTSSSTRPLRISSGHELAQNFHTAKTCDIFLKSQPLTYSDSKETVHKAKPRVRIVILEVAK